MGAARSFATTILLVSMVVPLQLRAQHNYVFTQVPTLGGPNIYANQTGAKNNLLNAVGALTGGAHPSLTSFARMTRTTVLQSMHSYFAIGLSSISARSQTDSTAQAFWINDSGTAVGFSQIGTTDPLNGGFPELRGTVWRNGQITSIGTFGGNNSMAQAVNNHGQVVGKSDTDGRRLSRAARCQSCR
jgi:uncharacterized membrane protein